MGIDEIVHDHHLPSIAASSPASPVATGSTHDWIDGVPRFVDVRATLRDGPLHDAIGLAKPLRAGELTPV